MATLQTSPSSSSPSSSSPSAATPAQPPLSDEQLSRSPDDFIAEQSAAQESPDDGREIHIGGDYEVVDDGGISKRVSASGHSRKILAKDMDELPDLVRNARNGAGIYADENLRFLTGRFGGVDRLTKSEITLKGCKERLDARTSAVLCFVENRGTEDELRTTFGHDVMINGLSKDAIYAFTWYEHTQLPGFKIQIARPDRPMVTCHMFADCIDYGDDPARALGTAWGRNLQVPPAVLEGRPKLRSSAQRRELFCLQAYLWGEQDILDIGSDGSLLAKRRPHFTGISDFDMKDLVARSLREDPSLAESENAIAYLALTTDVEIYRFWPLEASAQADLLVRWMSAAIYMTLKYGFWSFYQQEAKALGMSLDQQDVSLSELGYPQWLGTEFEVDTGAGARVVYCGTPKVLKVGQFAFGLGEISLPTAETAAFAFSMAISRARAVTAAILKSTFRDDWSTIARFDGVPDHPGSYFVSLRGKENSLLPKDKSLHPRVGTRLSIEVQGPPGNEQQVHSFTGLVSQDIFESHSEVCAIVVGVDLEGCRYPGFKNQITGGSPIDFVVNVVLKDDATPTNRQLMAIEVIKANLKNENERERRKQGVDIAHLVLRAPPTMPFTNSLSCNMDYGANMMAEDVKQRAKLNELQRVVFDKSLNAEHGITLTKGPPGTGKTHTKAACAIAHAEVGRHLASEEGLERRRPVMVCAPTNDAVTAFVDKLKNLNTKGLMIVRFKGASLTSRFKKVSSTKGTEMPDAPLSSLPPSAAGTSDAAALAINPQSKPDFATTLIAKTSATRLIDHVEPEDALMADSDEGSAKPGMVTLTPRTGKPANDKGKGKKVDGTAKHVQAGQTSQPMDTDLPELTSKEEAQVTAAEEAERKLWDMVNYKASQQASVDTYGDVDFHVVLQKTIKSWSAKAHRNDKHDMSDAAVEYLSKINKLGNTAQKMEKSERKQMTWDSRDLLQTLTGYFLAYVVDIVAVTNSSSVHVTLRDHFAPKVLISDENPICPLPDSATPAAGYMNSLQQVDLSGDPNQGKPYNPSVNLNEFGQILGLSWYQSILDTCPYEDIETRLAVQYRMHPQLSTPVSKIWYGGLLIDSENVKTSHPIWTTMQSVLASLGPAWTEHRLTAFDISGTDTKSGTIRHQKDGTSCFNQWEAKAIITFLRKVLDAPVPPHGSRISARDFLVITPYVAQAQHIRKLCFQHNINQVHIEVPDVTRVTTVKAVQGSESPFVIHSLTRNDADDHHRLQFAAEGDSYNVAVSRAQQGLFLFGNYADLIAIRLEPPSKGKGKPKHGIRLDDNSYKFKHFGAYLQHIHDQQVMIPADDTETWLYKGQTPQAKPRLPPTGLTITRDQDLEPQFKKSDPFLRAEQNERQRVKDMKRKKRNLPEDDNNISGPAHKTHRGGAKHKRNDDTRTDGQGQAPRQPQPLPDFDASKEYIGNPMLVANRQYPDIRSWVEKQGAAIQANEDARKFCVELNTTGDWDRAKKLLDYLAFFLGVDKLVLS